VTDVSVTDQLKDAETGILSWIDREVTGPMQDFRDPSQEWRRMFSELYGTFLLVIVAAGGGMMDQAFPNTIDVSAKFGSNDVVAGYSGGQG
jgi:aquaporin Z